MLAVVSKLLFCYCSALLELSTEASHFLINGKPVFLLGISYYAALGIPDQHQMEQDFYRFRALGFNWVRVWATWDAFGENISAVDIEGNPREPYFSRLKKLCQIAAEHGFIVDLTVTRGSSPAFPQTINQMQGVWKTLTKNLIEYRNVYFDVANERNIRDNRFVALDDVKKIITNIKTIDARRLCTASHGGDFSKEELLEYMTVAHVDMLCPHRPRRPSSPTETEQKTKEYLLLMQSIGKMIPLHYQEPFRRGYGKWEPNREDFVRDLTGALLGGAAGWCFHNGDNRLNQPEQRPRRSFDMRPSEGALWDQLDTVELDFVTNVRNILLNVKRVTDKSINVF